MCLFNAASVIVKGSLASTPEVTNMRPAKEFRAAREASGETSSLELSLTRF